MRSVQTPKHFARATNRVSTTSHNLLTFVPARLFKEATKSFNIFFLILCCIVMVPNLTPFSKSSYIMCVLMIISVNIVKAAAQELKKYSLDQKINNEKVSAVRRAERCEIARQDINIGEKILISKGVPLPVNILVLAAYTNTAEPVEKDRSLTEIHMETSAIDGESALKIVKPVLCLGRTGDLLQEELNMLETVEYSYDPEDHAGKLNVRLEDIEYNCSKKNIILTGASVYTECTVVGLSLGREKSDKKVARVKSSLFMNVISRVSIYIIAVYLGLLFLSSIGACVFMIKSEWLLGKTTISVMGEGLRSFSANVLIFSSLIPLSLFVTLEGLRVTYSIFIQADPEMSLDGEFAKCNTHGVLEDIGQITHILSDKTGTLTMNKMEFKGIYFPGEEAPMFFDTFSEEELPEQIMRLLGGSEDLLSMLIILLCHSVDAVNNEYIGVSQEEVCMLEYLKQFQVFLISRKNESIKISVREKVIEFKILAVLPFSAAVARMSIVVMAHGKVFLLSKGSDAVINCQGALEIGGEYRALMMAARKITQDDLEKYILENPAEEEKISTLIKIMEENNLNEIEKTSIISLSNQIAPKNNNYSEFTLPISFILYFENISEYAGTLYITDALQPNVEEIVETISGKGVKIWMATGDRKESAVACGISAGLTYNPYKVFSGPELIDILTERPNSNLMQESSVIVYRCAPEDKTKISRMLRSAGNILLSVGDGENDIGMIEEADIGVCVCGTESSRPSLYADLVIPSFHSLSRLVLYHGPVSLNRLQSVFLFFVFKSVCIAVCQCIYGVLVGSSGSMAPSSIFLLFFNALLSSPLSIEMGLFRKTCFKNRFSDALISGFLYGIASFLVVLKMFGEVDIMGKDGELGGHTVVSCFFSLCLFISTVSYFIYSAESFVLYSFFAIWVSVIFFIFSVGLENGFGIFLRPHFYMCAVYMTISAMLVERGLSVFQKEKMYRIMQGHEMDRI